VLKPRASCLKSKVIDAVNNAKHCGAQPNTTKSDNVSDDDCASMCKKLCSFFSDKVNHVRAAAAAAAAAGIYCTVNVDITVNPAIGWCEAELLSVATIGDLRHMTNQKSAAIRHHYIQKCILVHFHITILADTLLFCIDVEK